MAKRKALSPSSATDKLTRRGVVTFQKAILLENIKPLLTATFASILAGCERGDIKSMQIALELCGMTTTNKTPTIVNQVYAQSNSHSDAKADANASAVSESSSAISFEALARKLDARDESLRQQKPPIEITAAPAALED